MLEVIEMLPVAEIVGSAIGAAIGLGTLQAHFWIKDRKRKGE